MTIIYKIFDPEKSKYIDCEDANKVVEIMANLAWKFYFFYCRNKPFQKVVVNEDGSELWADPEGNETLVPVDVVNKIKELVTKDFTPIN